MSAKTKVSIRAYRYGGSARDELPEILKCAFKSGIFAESNGNCFNIAEIDERDNLILGRMRRLQEKDIPNVGTRTGEEETLDGKGLAHRAYFLIDPEKLTVFWLSSNQSCGANSIEQLAKKMGKRVQLAVFLDEDAFARASRNREKMVAVQIKVATHADLDLGLECSEELLQEARNLEADLFTLEFSVHRDKKSQKPLKSQFIWSTIEKLHKITLGGNKNIKSLRIVTADEATGEYLAENLIQQRIKIEFESDHPVQQMLRADAFALLIRARQQMTETRP